VAQRLPYVYYTGYYQGPDPEGSSYYIEKEGLFWQFNNQVAGFLSYPFNSVRRLEFSTGFSYINYLYEIVTDYYSPYDFSHVGRDRQKLPTGFNNLSLFNTSLALIYDSSVFGATGPILGQSYILQFSPTVGSLSYLDIIADYRRYLMPKRPFTLAFRALMYGRFGKNADDFRLGAYYLGYPSLVRGYDYYYSSDVFGQPNFYSQNRLYGSKIFVANAELRFPLFRLLGIGKGYYGVFPLDFIAFYDWGFAWWNNPPLGGFTFSEAMHQPVSSAGVGVRMNLFGFMVLGLNYVKPFARTGQGWYVQVSFWPGF
jgi:outer membrane protein assembly factor BamA